MKDSIIKLLILRSFISSALHSAWSEWRQEICHNDLDSYWCCDGRECGCYGATRREVFYTKDKPAIRCS